MRALLLCSVAAVLLSLAPAAHAEQPMARTVSTSGEAVVYVTPDEVIVTAQIYDHAARLRSFEILSAAAGLAAPA